MSAGNNKEFHVSWDEYHRDAKALAWRLAELGPWKGMVAVTRGGLVPAAIVSRELDIRIIETIGAISYAGGDGAPEKRGEIKILKEAAGVGNGEGWLIVDDLVDSGQTFHVLRQLFPKAHYAAVYAKPMGKPLTDTFITEVSQNTWIYLPWEKAGT